MPMDHIKLLSINGYTFGKGDLGITKAEESNGLISGNSSIFLNGDSVFDSPESLFYAMGHEFVHASQNIALMGENYSLLLKNDCIGEAKEFFAYSWEHYMGNSHYNGFKIKSCEDFTYYINRLNYINYSWLTNIIHP